MKRVLPGREAPKSTKKHSARPRTLSVAISGTIINNAQTPELKAYLAGQIARALSIFRVDEVVIFPENDSYDAKKACEYLARILEYLETPQYLRKKLFPIHRDLRFAGLLNPLDSPHHCRAETVLEFREGIVCKDPEFVFVGLRKPIRIPKMEGIAEGTRVTVRLDDKHLNSDTLFKKYSRHDSPTGSLVTSRTPVRELGIYWGYSVRIASSLEEITGNGRFRYDLTVGTSDKGESMYQEGFSLGSFKHLLLVFGGVGGLQECVGDAEDLNAVKSVAKKFDLWLNSCPEQGSRTIRTEEAVFITLASLQPFLHK